MPNSILLVLLADQTTVVDEAEEEPGYPHSQILIRPIGDILEVPDPTSSPGGDAPIVQRARVVELDIPFRRAAFDDEKAALLVDGQQRTAALSLTSVDQQPAVDFAVNAVVANEEEAKQVFQVANSTVKIATDFTRLLLSSTTGVVPGYQRQEQLRATVTRRLGFVDETSPFFGLVKDPGGRRSPQPIAWNTLFQVVAAFDGGVLPIAEDADKLARYVSKSFQLVKDTWPEAWGLPAGRSKLTHGAGMRSVASVLVHRLESQYEKAVEAGSSDDWEEDGWPAVKRNLEFLRSSIAWTDEEALTRGKSVLEFYTQNIAPKQNTQQDLSALTKTIRNELINLEDRTKRK